MKRSSRHFLTLAAALVLAASVTTAAIKAPASSAAAATAAKSADRYERTKAHIDALLKDRLNPDPLPVPLPNPFQVSGATPTNTMVLSPGATGPAPGPSTTKPAPEPVSSEPEGDAALLARYVPTLKVNGMVQLNGRVQLIINQTAYKEGDLILIGGKDSSIALQVVHIAPGELTVGLNDVTQTIKF